MIWKYFLFFGENYLKLHISLAKLTRIPYLSIKFTSNNNAVMLTIKKLSLLFLSILFVSLISKGDEEKSSLWSLAYPKEPMIPKVTNEKWVKNSIDHFILKKIEDQKLEPTPRAKKDKLVRRAYLDLLGIPPTLDEVKIFNEDRSSRAWEKLIEQLLKISKMTSKT